MLWKGRRGLGGNAAGLVDDPRMPVDNAIDVVVCRTLLPLEGPVGWEQHTLAANGQRKTGHTNNGGAYDDDEPENGVW